MGEIGKHLFYLKLENEVRVTYPPEKWGGDPRKVFIIDNLWLGNPLDIYGDAGLRARFLWFNNVLMTKIRGECDKGGQYVLFRFDENGTPCEEQAG